MKWEVYMIRKYIEKYKKYNKRNQITILKGQMNKNNQTATRKVQMRIKVLLNYKKFRKINPHKNQRVLILKHQKNCQIFMIKEVS